jgi:TolB-like protein/Tfp pilus assembly protein PilF
MNERVSFGHFRLDLVRRKLSRAGTPIKLGSRALDILCVLAKAKGELVTKDDLMAQVWPGIVVEDSNIQVHVSALRKALDEEKDGQSHIVTVPGRGYRLVSLELSLPAGQGATAERAPQIVPGTSIAVLPFQNMSGDQEQEYFADGVVDDIITGLSRTKWLFVIARNSTFIYKGKAVDVKQVGRELGVLYLLEGSVRKAANQVRINAQLIEAATGIHLWADRYDRLLDDIFAVQDEITASVIGAIEPSLRKLEIERVKRKRPDSLDAYDLVLRALSFTRSAMIEGAAAAIPLLQKALELEPNYAVAHAILARCFHVQFSRGGLHESDRSASIHHAHAAITGGSDDAATLATAGFVIWLDEHDITTAFDLFNRALAISHSNVAALSMSAFALAWMGKTELAIERANRALRVSPFDPWNSYLAHMALAVANFHAKRYEDARDAARHAIEANPGFSVPHILFVAVLVRLNEMDNAKAAARQVLALQPNFTIRGFLTTVGLAPEVYASFADAWREAGMPME